MMMPAQRPIEGSFERTLKVTGAVDLEVSISSGAIKIQPGAGDSVRITAHLTSYVSWPVTDATIEARIRQIEKTPPVEQDGNTVGIGRFADPNLSRHISISYDVTVPADTKVTARTESASVAVGAVKGSVSVNSASGSIQVDGAASLEAHASSGAITARAIAGRVSARSEAGSIVVEGRPAGPWSIDAASGSVTVTIPADAAFDLEARSSVGSVSSAHPVTMAGGIERNRLSGKVRAGGPLVKISTAAGSIQIR